MSIRPINGAGGYHIYALFIHLSGTRNLLMLSIINVIKTL